MFATKPSVPQALIGHTMSCRQRATYHVHVMHEQQYLVSFHPVSSDVNLLGKGSASLN